MGRKILEKAYLVTIVAVALFVLPVVYVLAQALHAASDEATHHEEVRSSCVTDLERVRALRNEAERGRTFDDLDYAWQGVDDILWDSNCKPQGVEP